MARHVTVQAAIDQEQSLGERRAELLTRARKSNTGQKRNVKPSSPLELGSEKPHVILVERKKAFVQKPLIENVTNSWRDVKQAPGEDSDEESEPELHCCDLEDETSFLSATYLWIWSKRFRRMLALVLGVLLVSYYVWDLTLKPRVQQAQEIENGFMIGTKDGGYGLARGGDFEGTRIRDLDSSLVPGSSSDPAMKRRLVFVGDIHGCLRELSTLLQKIDFKEERDHLIAVGDVVSKGPDSVAVLDELIRLKADTVRGNHEDRLIVMTEDGLRSDLPSQNQVSTTSKGAEKDAALLRTMKPHHIKYLRDTPLMLRIPMLPQVSTSRTSTNHIANEIMVVHAGLVPHLSLTKQDPYFVMNMRSIDHRTHIPSATRAGKSGRGKPWYEIWNWYNDRVSRGKSMDDFARLTDDQVLEAATVTTVHGWFNGIWKAIDGNSGQKTNPQVVIYGHDSKAGLQIHRWSKGLDSGCVSGGALTALVLDARGKQELTSVDCENYQV